MVEVRSPIAAVIEAPETPEEPGSLGDGYYAASHIITARERLSGHREYMVCWRGYSSSHWSWVPSADLSEPLLRYF